MGEKNWKLKLKYGESKTPYTHFTVLADGVAGDLTEGFECPKGSAWMSMKIWAIDLDESADMITVIGEQIGFKVTGKVEIFETDPEEPPRENTHGYDIKFTPYDE